MNGKSYRLFFNVQLNTRMVLYKSSRTPSFFRSITSAHLVSCQPVKYEWSHVGVKERIENFFTDIKLRLGFDPRLPPEKRKHIVVLGTGWSCFRFISRLNIKYFDISIISPRHAFTFTPLLPSVCGGLLTTNACFEPLRDKLLLRGGRRVMSLYEASATDLDVEKNQLDCISQLGQKFKINYDYLVISVGTETNTFNIPGVSENGFFLKEAEHAKRIHAKILTNFEAAALPETSDEEKSRLLHFVVVGGGATGVEAAAEIADFINLDAPRYFGSVCRFAKVTLIEMQPKILPVYTKKASEFAERNLKKSRVDILLSSQVTKLDSSTITVKTPNGSCAIPCGAVIWASGVKQVPFVQNLLSKFSLEKSRALVVNEHLQVQGLPSNIFAAGDCALVRASPLVSKAEELYQDYVKSESTSTVSWLRSSQRKLNKSYPQLTTFSLKNIPSDQSHKATKDAFVDLLNSIDHSFMSPPPTAQNATQQGHYLAFLFNHYLSHNKTIANAPPFIYRWKGSMAYVGRGQSILETPWAGSWFGGHVIHLFWRLFYWSHLASHSSRTACLVDWMRSCVRGRYAARQPEESSRH